MTALKLIIAVLGIFMCLLIIRWDKEDAQHKKARFEAEVRNRENSVKFHKGWQQSPEQAAEVDHEATHIH